MEYSFEFLQSQLQILEEKLEGLKSSKELMINEVYDKLYETYVFCIKYINDKIKSLENSEIKL